MKRPEACIYKFSFVCIWTYDIGPHRRRIRLTRLRTHLYMHGYTHMHANKPTKTAERSVQTLRTRSAAAAVKSPSSAADFFAVYSPVVERRGAVAPQPPRRSARISSAAVWRSAGDSQNQPFHRGVRRWGRSSSEWPPRWGLHRNPVVSFLPSKVFPVFLFFKICVVAIDESGEKEAAEGVEDKRRRWGGGERPTQSPRSRCDAPRHRNLMAMMVIEVMMVLIVWW